jgi:hypothetical protein
MKMAVPVLFRKHFQIAYVFRDARHAMARFGKRMGVAKWDLLDMVALTGADSAVRYIANAYAGDVMIELIEPFPERPSIYRDWIPASDDAARFHHLGFLAETQDAWRAAVDLLAEDGFAVVHTGSYGDLLDFQYVDTVKELGHFYELIHLKPGGVEFFARIPNN